MQGDASLPPWSRDRSRRLTQSPRSVPRPHHMHGGRGCAIAVGSSAPCAPAPPPLGQLSHLLLSLLLAYTEQSETFAHSARPDARPRPSKQPSNDLCPTDRSPGRLDFKPTTGVERQGGQLACWSFQAAQHPHLRATHRIAREMAALDSATVAASTETAAGPAAAPAGSADEQELKGPHGLEGGAEAVGRCVRFTLCRAMICASLHGKRGLARVAVLTDTHTHTHNSSTHTHQSHRTTNQVVAVHRVVLRLQVAAAVLLPLPPPAEPGPALGRRAAARQDPRRAGRGREHRSGGASSVAGRRTDGL